VNREEREGGREREDDDKDVERVGEERERGAVGGRDMMMKWKMGEKESERMRERERKDLLSHVERERKKGD
jgi:hypothetical protein